MSLTITTILLVAFTGMTVFAGWRGAQPPDLKKGPRMVPWRFVMLLCGACSVLLLIHLAALAGAPMRSALPFGNG